MLRNLLSNISLALSAVWAQKLRSGLTLLSISIGVFAIISASTASSSLDAGLTSNLAALGRNTIMIERAPNMMVHRHNRSQYRNRKPIVYRQARDFKRRMAGALSVSIASADGRSYRIKAGNKRTNPDVMLSGADFNYFASTNLDVEEGRSLSDEDVAFNRPVAVIGADVAAILFPSGSPIGREIRISARSFQVVGLLKSKGASMGRSLDNVVIVPVSYYLNNFADRNTESLSIYVNARNNQVLEETIDEAIGIMRVLRNVQPGAENDFEVQTNESLTSQFSDVLQGVNYFALFSGILALITAGIGIMNIMLVSVRERTREIGVRKALGAKKRVIMGQFLVESITLCQLGGIIGIFIGIYLTAALMNALGATELEIIIPWGSVAWSVLFCTAIGLIFGMFPAWLAARLDPIEALRYE